MSRLSSGGIVVVIDSDQASLDGMGVLVMAADRADADALREFIRLASGITYLALTEERCDALGLELVAARDDSLLHAPRTMTIAAREGVGSGVGLAERARTIAVAIDPSSTRDQIRMGGHINPLRARPGGVLERSGPTEAAIDLMRMAGQNPAALLGEVLLPDGTEAKSDALIKLAARHDLPVVTIGQLIAKRRREEPLVRRIVQTAMPTASGDYEVVGYIGTFDEREHLALVRGDVVGQQDILVYIHLACWEGDVFRSKRCDCRARLDAATAAIGTAQRGVIVHLAADGYDRHEPRGHDDTFRDFGVGAQILADLGLGTVRVLTDRPRPLPGLDGYGLTITGHEPLLGPPASNSDP